MNKKVVIILLLFFIASFAGAQSPAKEAMNFFAHYSQKHQFSDLEKAKKAIDEGFKTKRDSLSYRNNLIRGMVYSTLAFVDSNRKLSKEPIQIGLHSLSSLTNSKFNEEHGGEISYIKKQLANAFLREAAKFLKDFNYEDAYDSYRWVDSLNSGTSPAVKHNLAVLSQRLGYRSRAIGYYEQLIEDKPKASPVYYLALSELYEAQLDLNKSLDIIKKGREAFPHNQD